MKSILILVIGILAGAGGFWLISKRHEAQEPEHEVHRQEKAAHGENVINLDKKQQEAAHIETALPEKARLAEEVKAYGHVLDPSPLVTLILEVQAAEATATASRKEFERLNTLFAQGQNASARSLETAEAATKRDQALHSLAESKFRTALGPDLMNRKDLGEIIQGLSKMDWALARIDVLSGAPEKLPPRVRISPLTDEHKMLSAELLGRAATAEASIQGRGFVLLIRTNSLPPNTAIVGSMEIPGHDHESVLIPAQAILQEGPDTVVFVQASDETFKKAPVEVERVTEKGAYVREGLTATNRVVVAGAHQILSVTKAEAEE